MSKVTREWGEIKRDWEEGFSGNKDYRNVLFGYYLKWTLWRSLMKFASLTLYRHGYILAAASLSTRFKCGVCQRAHPSRRVEIIVRKGMNGLGKEAGVMTR